jgi:hypothetical protein
LLIGLCCTTGGAAALAHGVEQAFMPAFKDWLFSGFSL